MTNTLEQRARELLAAEVERDAIATPSILIEAERIRNGTHGSAFTDAALRAIEAALRLAVPEEWVLVPRDAAAVAAAVADEWEAMFRDIPGIEKYEQFTYGPAVEQMRADMLAAAPSVSEGEG